MVQLQIADDISQSGSGQIFNRGDRAFHAVGIHFRVCNLEIHYSVDLHRYVILGDYRLGRKIHYLLLQGYLTADPVHERNLYVESGSPGGVVSA